VSISNVYTCVHREERERAEHKCKTAMDSDLAQVCVCLCGVHLGFVYVNRAHILTLRHIFTLTHTLSHTHAQVHAAESTLRALTDSLAAASDASSRSAAELVETDMRVLQLEQELKDLEGIGMCACV
jgi:hypothetical protein